MGEQETRAYSYPHGCTAREAAGYIHSDFEKGFVKAEITPAASYLKTSGRANSRIEAADYVRTRHLSSFESTNAGIPQKMQDGDIMVVRFK